MISESCSDGEKKGADARIGLPNQIGIKGVPFSRRKGTETGAAGADQPLVRGGSPICWVGETANSPASAQKRERSGLWKGEINREEGEFRVAFSDESDQE